MNVIGQTRNTAKFVQHNNCNGGTVRCAVGRSQNVCKWAQFSFEGERCVLSSRSLHKRLEVNEEEKEEEEAACGVDPHLAPRLRGGGHPCPKKNLKTYYGHSFAIFVREILAP